MALADVHCDIVVKLEFCAPAGSAKDRSALGPGTGWEHVFAVMAALAGRYGDDSVRIVAWFD